MLNLFITLCFVAISSFPVKAQNIMLPVHQYDPLKISTASNQLRVLSGNKIVLGNELTLSGGYGTYQIIWSSTGWGADSTCRTITVAPLDTTAYNLKIIDENKCSTEQLFHVNVISPLQLECKTSPISCYGKNDGGVTLKITGGAAPYTIAWSNGKNTDVLNNLKSGDYTVTVTDDIQQKQVRTITLKQPDEIRKVLDIPICNGSFYKFAGINRTAAGQYQDTLKAKSGCDSIVVLNLTVNPLPGIPVITQKGDTLRSSSSLGNQWSKDGVDIKDENKQTFVLSSSGSYTVLVTNSNGCSSRSEANLYIKTDVPMIKTAEFTCTVFPNPNNGLFTVELTSVKSNKIVLELLAMDGKLIVKKTVEHPAGRQLVEFGKTNLAGGIYLLQIKFGSQIISQKLIIK